MNYNKETSYVYYEEGNNPVINGLVREKQVSILGEFMGRERFEYETVLPDTMRVTTIYETVDEKNIYNTKKKFHYTTDWFFGIRILQECKQNIRMIHWDVS
ncbi:hypothetical protein BC1_00017 [Bacillus phage BC-1]|nr:hypothetical protein BC1_00017 [Bacillus phage BC-1]